MNSNAIQDFLFRHVEKFIFGALVLLAVFLVYRGFQLPDYLSEQQPDRMEQGAVEVKTAIDVDHWEKLAEERVEAVDVVARTNESIRPVNPQVYRLSPWEAKSIDISVKRQDPAIAAPIQLRVTGVIAAIAQKTAKPYALTTLENAEPIEKKVPEPKRPKRSRRPLGMDMGYGDEMTEMGYGEEEPEMELDYGAGGMDATGGTVAAVPERKIDAALYDQGYRPEGSMENLAPAMGHFIAGVALMPHKKLVSEFEATFQQADGYSALRDQPVYLQFDLQRADVTDKSVDQLAAGDWVPRGNSMYFKLLLIRQWAGMAKEIVAGKYRDPELTMAIPPVLLKHYAKFASHPEIPLGDVDPMAGQPTVQETLPTGPVIFDPNADPLASGLAPLPRFDGGMGMGMDGMGMDDMGSGMEMDYGMMMDPFGSQANVDHPEYKLIRFYDFRDLTGKNDPTAPKPGRKYVYRIRVAIEDPNFPRNAAAQPRNSTLSAEVFRRVQAKTDAATKSNSRDARRWSDYSEPSPIVSLPPTTQAFAGPVTPSPVRKLQVSGREIEFPLKPPVGKLVVAEWNKKYQVPVPLVMDVQRGSVLAKTGEFEVPDPLSLIVKKLPDTTINTQAVVLDMGGGAALAISPGENQTEPAVMLLFDAEGGLRVVDEVDSQQGYRLYSYADLKGE